mgnify:CR=1 FL=1
MGRALEQAFCACAQKAKNDERAIINISTFELEPGEAMAPQVN